MVSRTCFKTAEDCVKRVFCITQDENGKKEERRIQIWLEIESKKIHSVGWIFWIRILFQIFFNGTLKPELDCVNPNPDSLIGTRPECGVKRLIDPYGTYRP